MLLLLSSLAACVDFLTLPLTLPLPPAPHDQGQALPAQHDAIVRFHYQMSGASVLVGNRPFVVTCSFKHRWYEVIAAARVHSGLPLQVTWPPVNGADHVLATCASTREVRAYVVVGPPSARTP